MRMIRQHRPPQTKDTKGSWAFCSLSHLPKIPMVTSHTQCDVLGGGAFRIHQVLRVMPS